MQSIYDIRFKAALFDLDGVVFDTEPQYTIFWGEQCRRYHPEEPGLEHRIKGQTLTQIFDAHFSGDLLEEQGKITERLNDFESKMNFIYVAGFLNYIQRLRQEGVKTAVVTSSNKVKMQAVSLLRSSMRFSPRRILPRVNRRPTAICGLQHGSGLIQRIVWSLRIASTD